MLFISKFIIFEILKSINLLDMENVNRLKEIANSYYQRINQDIELENLNNPYDYYGMVHNRCMDYISERLSEIIVPNYVIDTQCKKSCIGVDINETEKQLAKHIEIFLRELSIGKTIEIPDIRPQGLTLYGILKSVPKDIIDKVYVNGKLTEPQKDIIVSYLEESKRIYPDITSFVGYTKELENGVVKTDLLSEKEKEVVLKVLAIGKYSAFYTFKLQSDLQTIWNPVNGTWYPGDANFYRVNWWKVLACDCIGGAVGGPGGYVGASATSVVMQL